MNFKNRSTCYREKNETERETNPIMYNIQQLIYIIHRQFNIYIYIVITKNETERRITYRTAEHRMRGKVIKKRREEHRRD